jgi:hypothetical protein
VSAGTRGEMKSGADFAATTVLLVLQALVSLFAVAVTFLDGLSVGPCVSTCDYDLKWFAFALTPVVALTAFVVVIVGLGVLRFRRSHLLTWWIPAAGLVVVMVALFISRNAADIAMRV